MDSGQATKSDVERLEGHINLLQWMIGTVLAVGLANLYMIIKVSQQIG